jgi:hypothetical protein
MRTHKTNVTLWVVQGLLAALFLMAGVSKLVMPIEAMTQQIPFPGWFLRFIGTAETLGALGLILPCLTRIKPYLTPLAASGLIVIMTGAVTLSLATMGAAAAVLPFVAGTLAAFVAYGRTRLAPRPARQRRAAVTAATAQLDSRAAA